MVELHVRLPAIDRGTEPVGQDVAALAWERVRAEFDEVDRALSRFRDDSELTAMNRLAGTGRVVAVCRAGYSGADDDIEVDSILACP